MNEKNQSFKELWFDVEKERDTTACACIIDMKELWFDVEKERDTTSFLVCIVNICCGLM